MRDPAKERGFPADNGVLTTDFAAIRDDPSINVVAEVMGGLEPAGGYVRELLRAGKPVVSANKQLVAREGADLFAIASAAGVQLRFEASVCAAIPVVKVLRESLIATNVHRILGIVNGTTNFILSRMERGDSYAAALAEAQELGYAEADPSDDVNGADAAAKMAILATVAFGSRVAIDEVETRGITEIEPAHVAAAADLGMVVRLVGIATLANDAVDVRVQPAFVQRSHPLAAVDGAFNAVMLQGDAIREITLEGPGAGGTETASAVVADLVSVVGTAGTGFLQNDACWRELERLDPDAWRSPFYVHLDVADRAGRARARGEPARGARRLGRAARAAPRRRPGRARSRLARSAARAGRGRARRDLRIPRGARASVRRSRRHGYVAVTITLGEGNTPLLHAPRLSERLGVDLWLKWEGANPTGSFKDRGMSVAMTKAVEDGATTVVCASTGNTAASAAAYAARAGLEAVIVVAAGGPASSKLVQVRAVGGRIVEIDGSFSDAYAHAEELAAQPGHVLVNSTNPHRIEGQKTAAFEILDAARRDAGRAHAPVRRRRQHEGLRARLPRGGRRAAAFSSCRIGATADDVRLCDSHLRPDPPGRRRGCARAVGRLGRDGRRRRDRERMACPRP